MPYQKGTTGNPNGRPKATKGLTEALKLFMARENPTDANLRTYRECLIDKLVSKAVGGDLFAIKEILDRVDGKPMQAHTLENDPNKPFKVLIEYIGS